jgi:hypothetical protein
MFWREDCPARGVALTHVHENECDDHPQSTCCFCLTDQGSWKPPKADREVPDHEYVFTIVGRCGRDKCGRLAEEHLSYRKKKDGTIRCVVEHESIKTPWTKCPMCGVTVEPKMATGIAIGPAWGPGRGILTRRHQDKLVKLVKREKFWAWMQERGKQ